MSIALQTLFAALTVALCGPARRRSASGHRPSIICVEPLETRDSPGALHVATPAPPHAPALTAVHHKPKPATSHAAAKPKHPAHKPVQLNRPQRGNNPLDIKDSTATHHWIANGLATDDPTKATDGGHFLKFNDPATGWKAAKELLTSGTYNGLAVDAALMKWSGHGYGIGIAPELQGLTAKDPKTGAAHPVRIGELTPGQLNGLLHDMAQHEGFFAHGHHTPSDPPAPKVPQHPPTQHPGNPTPPGKPNKPGTPQPPVVINLPPIDDPGYPGDGSDTGGGDGGDGGDNGGDGGSVVIIGSDDGEE